ncbi:DUF389 domain-containing protein [Xenococcus sp. PCC 7305]|uniref:DUF389 domain-containing protein n=1 Tax=Xenococcus sp. PCC 7305 TaxID=102125 RepID=UPI001930C3FE|nr:DUF389 domain-containing protein [Xenococcus sp. PCC 7305]
MKIENPRIIKFLWLKVIRFVRQLLPTQVNEVYVRKLDRELCQDATWNLNYIILTVSSCLIATFGLISNSTAVIIGAMLVAPLMLPLRALAFGALEGDFGLFKRAFLSIVGATIVSLSLSYFAGDAANIPQFGSEVLSRTQPNLVDLGIAVVAGGISSFAKVRKGVSDVIAGTAIAVALMPPLCVVGLALSQQQTAYAKGAFLLYLTNLLGITLSCMVVFILAGYSRINHTLGWTLALTGILVIPLGASFLQLVRQAQLEMGINKTLNETITVTEGVDNATIEVDWTENPPIVYILLQTSKDVVPNQVGLVEEFIERKLGKSFKLVFFVNKFTQVTAEENIIETEKEISIPTEPETQTEEIIPKTETELETNTETESSAPNELKNQLEETEETISPATETKPEVPLQPREETGQAEEATQQEKEPEAESTEKKSIPQSLIERPAVSEHIPPYLKLHKPPKNNSSVE